MARTVSNLKDSVGGLLSGLDLSNVDSLYKAFERAARVFVQKAKIPETQGIQNITLYDGVTDYLIDTRIFGTSVLDISPQGVSRSPNNFVFHKFADDFDRQKQFKQLATMCAFDYLLGVPIIRIVTRYTPQRTIIDTMTATTGWVASGSASALTQDTGIFYQSPASLRMTLTGASIGILTKTISSTDLSRYTGVGVGFLAIQIPDGSSATDLTGIEVRIGSDSGNYYTATATTGFLGAWTVGNWLLVSFNGATATGSPDMTKATYVQVRLTTGTTIGNFRLGGMWISMPTQEQIRYSSAGFFKVGGVVSQTITSDNDQIILSDPAYTIYEYECGLAILEQTGGGASDSTIALFNNILNGLRARNGIIVQLGLYDLYRGENPSAVLRTAGSYYSGSSYGDGYSSYYNN